MIVILFGLIATFLFYFLYALGLITGTVLSLLWMVVRVFIATAILLAVIVAAPIALVFIIAAGLVALMFRLINK